MDPWSRRYSTGVRPVIASASTAPEEYSMEDPVGIPRAIRVTSVGETRSEVNRMLLGGK